MEMILFKPNPIIEGVFGNSNARDFNVFNKILCDLQVQKANNEFMAIVSLDEIRKLISDVNVSTPEKIQNYLNNNFREKTITWRYKHLITSVGLINSTVFDETNMTYKITVDKEIVNLILNYDELKTGYTPLNLKLKSKNFYATKIYEYLRKWSGNKNSLNIGLYQLKELLSLEGSYNDFKNFRVRVLDPSINEINKNFNMEISFEAIKTGNKITAIEFHFTDNESRHYSFDEIEVINGEIKETSFTEIDVIDKKLNEFGLKIATSTINKLKIKYSESLIHNAVDIMCNNSKQGKITAPVKYLTGILENLNNKTVDNIKQLKFNNFEAREKSPRYQYLEEQILIGHASEEERKEFDEMRGVI